MPRRSAETSVLGQWPDDDSDRLRALGHRVEMIGMRRVRSRRRARATTPRSVRRTGVEIDARGERGIWATSGAMNENFARTPTTGSMRLQADGEGH